MHDRWLFTTVRISHEMRTRLSVQGKKATVSIPTFFVYMNNSAILTILIMSLSHVRNLAKNFASEATNVPNFVMQNADNAGIQYRTSLYLAGMWPTRYHGKLGLSLIYSYSRGLYQLYDGRSWRRQV